MLIDVHSHYMPKALARALEARSAAPRIFSTDGKTLIEYGERSIAPLMPVFFEPELILERMNEAAIDHALLSVSIPGVDWLDPDQGEEVAEASNEETAAIVARNPDRFSGLATVPLQAPERATQMLQHAIDLGLKGAMILKRGWRPPGRALAPNLLRQGRVARRTASAASDLPALRPLDEGGRHD